MIAVAKGNNQIVEPLIEKGVDMTWVFEPKDAADWTSPLVTGMNGLMYAAYRGEVKAIELLIGKGLDVTARTKDGLTVLQAWQALKDSGPT